MEPEGFSEEALRVLGSFAEITQMRHASIPTMSREIGAFDGIVVRLANRFDADFFREVTNLQVIGSPTTGLDHIDTISAQERGVSIISLKSFPTPLRDVWATAELTMAIMLAASRKILAASKHVYEGNWNRNEFRGVELRGKTLGVLGMGRVGTQITSIAKGFGMEVIFYDTNSEINEPRAKRLGVEEVFKKSDFLSIHIPHCPENVKFVNMGLLRHLRPSAYLINTSRGSVIDEKSLLELAQAGRIAGFALDVLEQETSESAFSEQIISFAASSPSSIVTPHIGGWTVESSQKTEVIIAEEMKNYFLFHEAP